MTKSRPLKVGDEMAAGVGLFDASVTETLNGNAVPSDDLTYVTGQTGPLGVKSSWRLMNERDALPIANPGFSCSGFPPKADAPYFPSADFAGALGFGVTCVDTPETIGPAFSEVLSADRHVRIDARVDPNMPTRPPHITLKQERSFARALLRRDPEASSIVRRTTERVFA